MLSYSALILAQYLDEHELKEFFELRYPTRIILVGGFIITIGKNNQDIDVKYHMVRLRVYRPLSKANEEAFIMLFQIIY
jgi:hypothetical protein